MLSVLMETAELLAPTECGETLGVWSSRLSLLQS